MWGGTSYLPSTKRQQHWFISADEYVAASILNVKAELGKPKQPQQPQQSQQPQQP
jgi:hypothetical protein